MAKKQQTKICGICLKEIKLKSDSYMQVIDYKEGKFFMEGYYHNSCYHESIGRGKKTAVLQNETLRLLKFAKEKLGIEDKKEVVIQ